MIRALVTRLHDDRCFVIAHLDGDRVYSESEGGRRSENLDLLQERVLPAIQALLPGRNAMESVLLLVPFYSIEAWLYQNVEEALRIHEERFHGRTGDMELFRLWRKDRGLLDEVEKPKDRVSMGAEYNHRLAKGFPSTQVLAVGKSYEKTVARLRECSPLMQALAASRRRA